MMKITSFVKQGFTALVMAILVIVLVKVGYGVYEFYVTLRDNGPTTIAEYINEENVSEDMFSEYGITITPKVVEEIRNGNLDMTKMKLNIRVTLKQGKVISVDKTPVFCWALSENRVDLQHIMIIKDPNNFNGYIIKYIGEEVLAD